MLLGLIKVLHTVGEERIQKFISSCWYGFERLILDLVITNDSFIDNIDYLAPLGNSDHSLLDITYNSSGFSKVDTKKFNFSKGDYAQIRTDLNIDWDSALSLNSEDIDTMWVKFKNIIHQTIDINIPQSVRH